MLLAILALATADLDRVIDQNLAPTPTNRYCDMAGAALSSSYNLRRIALRGAISIQDPEILKRNGDKSVYFLDENEKKYVESRAISLEERANYYDLMCRSRFTTTK